MIRFQLRSRVAFAGSLLAALLLSACEGKDEKAGTSATPTPGAPQASTPDTLPEPPAWDAQKYPLLESRDLYQKTDYRDLGEVKNPDDVYRLWVTSQQVNEFPGVILQCKRLQHLRVQNCPKVGKVPPELFQLRNLQQLSLTTCGLASLPREIGWLTNLEELSLSDNKLTTLPKEIGRLKSLKDLTLSTNGLTSFPEGILELDGLADLTLNTNKITTVPKEIGRLKSLKELNLNSNELTSLPDTILDLENLSDLSVGWNKLEALPEIGKLKKLTRLQFHDNPRLKKLPESFAQLNLTYGTLNRCASLDLADAFAKLAKHSKLKELRMDNMRNADVSLFGTLFGGPPEGAAPLDMPENLGELKGLTLVSLEYNIFTASGVEKIFGAFAKMPGLEDLNLNSCYVESLPATIQKLASLKRLNLGSTPIKELPPEIAKLSKLETLDLRRCNLQKLPPLKGLANLKNLWLWDLKIESLPSLDGLASLEDLSLYGCKKITQLPPLEGLANLKKLDLSGTAVPKPVVDELKKKLPKVSISS